MEKNFKDLKDNITKAVFESVITGTKSKNFKKFVAEVKKSPILKEQLDIYNLVENEKFETKEDASFIFERAMRVFEKYTADEIEAANKAIVESFGGEFDGSDSVYQAITNLYAQRNTGRQDYGAQGQNVRKLIESMVTVKDVVSEETIPAAPNKKVINRAVEILNEKFSFLSDTEKAIFKSFLAKDEAGKEAAYETLISENLQLAKRKLYESEDESLDGTLEQIVSKLNEDKYSPEKNINDFVKLLNLTQTLH